MKKVIYATLLIAISVILFTGCEKKEKVLTCKLVSDQEASGYVLNTTYDIYYKGNVVSKIELKEDIKSDSETILSYFEKSLKEQYDANNKKYGGYENTVTNKDGKVNTDVIIDFTKMDLKKYVEDNPAMENFLDKDNMTLDGIKTLYESMGATCDK